MGLSLLFYQGWKPSETDFKEGEKEMNVPMKTGMAEPDNGKMMGAEGHLSVCLGSSGTAGT